MTFLPKVAKDTILIGLSQQLLALRALLLLPVIAKLLGTEAYGAWVQVGVTLSLLSMFCVLGVEFSFVRMYASVTDKKQIRFGFFALLFTIIGVSCPMALGLAVYAGPVASALFGSVENESVVQVLALILPFWSVNFLLLAYFRTFRQMKMYVLLVTIQGFGELLGVMAFVLSGAGVVGAVLGSFAAISLTAVLALALIIFQIGLCIPPPHAFAILSPCLRLSVPLMLPNIAIWATNLSDRYVISIVLGIGAVGIYSGGYTLASTLRLFFSPLNFVLVPALSELYDNGKIAEVKHLLSSATRYLFMLAIPGAVGVSLLADSLLRLLTSVEIANFGPAIVPLIAASMLLWGVYTIAVQIITLEKKPAVTGLAWGIAAIANLGLNLILVPRFGLTAAAATTLVAFSVATMITVRSSLQYLRFRIDWIFFFKVTLASIVMGIVVWTIAPRGIPAVTITILTGAITYFITLALLRGFETTEIAYLSTMWPFRKRPRSS